MLRRCFSSSSTVSGIAAGRRIFQSSSCWNSVRWSSSSSSSAGGTPPPPRGKSPLGSIRYTDAEIREVVHALEDDPELAVRVVNSMSPSARRQLVVAGSAFEWFGGQGAAQSEVSAADVDNDTVISSKDFDVWFEQALERRAREAATAAQAAERKSKMNHDSSSASSSAGGAPAGSSAPSSTAAAAGAVAGGATGLTLGCLVMIAVEAGLPFVGFGFLDNAVMILSGDAIDRSVGAFLGCSVLASAAMGNVVSGMLGMQIHGSIERLVHFFKLPVPALSEEQRKSRKVFLAGHIGGTIGIACGLALGMMPLMFISDKGEERSFSELDTNKDDIVDEGELQKALREAGIEYLVSAEVAHNLMKKFGGKVNEAGKLGLTPDQFHNLCTELRTHGPLGLTAVKLVAETEQNKAPF